MLISDLTNPVQGQDGATKAYVDDKILINVVDDTSTLSVLRGGETLAIRGGSGVTTALDGDVLTITADLFSTVDGSITATQFKTDGIDINGNEIITRRSNENLELIPNGTGIVEVLSNASATGSFTEFAGALSSYTGGFHANRDTISTSETLDTGSGINSVVYGPITIANGATFTIADDSKLKILEF